MSRSAAERVASSGGNELESSAVVVGVVWVVWGKASVCCILRRGRGDWEIGLVKGWNIVI